MPLTLDQFRRAQGAQSGRLPADVVESVIACFEFYVSNSHKPGMTMERAFGASGGSGCDQWFVKLAFERRDQAIRNLAAAIVPDGSIAKQRDAVRLAISVYRPTWNRRDQFRDRPANNEPRARWLFAAFREARIAGTDLPDSPSYIWKILAGKVIDMIEEPLLFKTSI
jgi:hypothetical protein